MKKLLVVALVLGMASLANAGIVMSIDKLAANVGETVTISVGWDGSGATDWLGYVDVFGANVTGVALGAHAGDIPQTLYEGPYEYLTGQEVKMVQAWVASTPVAGTAFNITLTKGAGDVLVQLWDDALGYETPASEVTITAVPEPATLAILGLGGLLLRRKK